MVDCKKVKALDNAMKKSVLKSPLTVYHGMGDKEGEMFGDKGAGSTFTNSAFMSTSTRKTIASNFSRSEKSKRRILVIDLPAGSNAIAYGDTKYESEVLLPRNSSFTITRTRIAGDIEYIYASPS